MDRLRSFLNLERGEELPAFLLFFYLTLAMASYIVVKSASKGLYLSRYSFATLPYVYIGVAVLVGLVVSVYVRLASRLSQVTLISATLLFFLSNALLLWWGLRVRWSPAAAIYILWTGVFGVIVATQVWTVANHVLDLRQAKRLFPLVASGGILGSAGGGLIGAALVKRVGTDNLLLLLIPTLLLSVGIVQILLRRFGFSSGSEKGSTESKKGVKDVFHTIASSRYLKLIVGLVALSAVVGLIVNWQFDAVVQKSFGSKKDQITIFLASFQGFLSLFSFLVQVVVGSRIVEKLGVRVTLLMLPLALLGGTGILLLNPLRLWAAGLLRGSDGALRYSVDKATNELLYVPVSQSVKAQVKAVTDMVVNRFADGVGGLVLLVMTKVFGLGLSGVGLFNLVLISLWFWAVLETRKEYVATIHRNLTDRPEIPPSTLRMLFEQPGSIATLRTMFASKDEEVVLYAMEAAGGAGHNEWIPASLTTHPSPRVRLKAVEVVPMTEQEILKRVQEENDSTVRASVIIRACKVAQPQRPMSALSQFLSASDLRVRLSALLCLVRQAREGEKETVKQFLDHIADELDAASKEWKDVAEVLGEISQSVAVDLHLRLLQHPDVTVRRQAILSAGRAGHRELVPFLVPLLADRQWAADARLALRDYGPRILGSLADMLKDPSEDLEVRRNIPLVLAYFPQQESVDLLLDSLFDYDGLLRYRAIRALGKLRLIDPELRFDSAKVRLHVQEECETTLWFEQALASLYPKVEGPELLVQLLKDKISRGRERVFRLLALLLPASAACASFLAMLEEDRLRKATAAELLDNVLPRGLKEWVLPLLEPKAGGGRHKLSVQTILEACLKNPDPILRECTADAIAKRRWAEVPGRA